MQVKVFIAGEMIETRSLMTGEVKKLSDQLDKVSVDIKNHVSECAKSNVESFTDSLDASEERLLSNFGEANEGIYAALAGLADQMGSIKLSGGDSASSDAMNKNLQEMANSIMDLRSNSMVFMFSTHTIITIITLISAMNCH